MPIQFKCSNCAAVLNCPEHRAGTAIKCPKCSATIEIPKGSAADSTSVARPPRASAPAETARPGASCVKPADRVAPASAAKSGAVRPVISKPAAVNTPASGDPFGLDFGAIETSDLPVSSSTAPAPAQGQIAPPPKPKGLPQWVVYLLVGAPAVVLLCLVVSLASRSGETSGGPGDGHSSVSAAPRPQALSDDPRQVSPRLAGPAPDTPPLVVPAFADQPAAPPSISDVVERVEQGVILITVMDASGRETALGTGFVIDRAGLVATSHHVVREATRAFAQFKDGSKYEIKGYRSFDPKGDLAILELASIPRNLAVLTLNGNDKLRQGSEVIAIGHPSGFRFAISNGIISAVHLTASLPEAYREELDAPPHSEWIQTTAAISGGNSGGPLLNRAGEVIGINTWVAQGQNLGFAAHVKHLIDLQRRAAAKATPLAEANATPGVSVTTRMGKLSPELELMSQELRRAVQNWVSRLSRAGSAADAQKLMAASNPFPDFIRRFNDVAMRNRKTTTGLQALMMACMISQNRLGTEKHFSATADRIYEDYLNEPALGGALLGLVQCENREVPGFMARVAEATNQRDSRGIALLCQSLALVRHESSKIIHAPKIVRNLELVMKDYGQVTVESKKLSELASSVLFKIQHLSIGSEAPELVAARWGPSREEFRLSSLRGKVVVLDFFADWCPYCQQMYPQERILVDKFRNEAFELVGICADDKGQTTRIINARGITWTCLPDGPSGPIADQWQVASYPSVFVLDAAGVVRYVFHGDPGSELELAIQKLLDEQKPPTSNDRASVDYEATMTAVEESLATEPLLEVADRAIAIIKANPKLASKKDYALVGKWLKTVIRQAPNAWPVQFTMAELREAEGNLSGAIAIYRTLLKRTDVTGKYRALVQSRLARLLAIHSQSVKDRDEAVKLANAAFKSLGPDTELLITRALLSAAQDQKDRALEDMERALESAGSGKNYFYLALITWKAGDAEGAQQAIRHARFSGFDPAQLGKAERKQYDQMMEAVGAVASSTSPNETAEPGSSWRTWSDRSGKFKVEAKCIKFEAGMVRLETRTGKVVSVPIEKLGDEDQAFVRKQSLAASPSS